MKEVGHTEFGGCRMENREGGAQQVGIGRERVVDSSGEGVNQVQCKPTFSDQWMQNKGNLLCCLKQIQKKNPTIMLMKLQPEHL